MRTARWATSAILWLAGCAGEPTEIVESEPACITLICTKGTTAQALMTCRDIPGVPLHCSYVRVDACERQTEHQTTCTHPRSAGLECANSRIMSKSKELSDHFCEMTHGFTQ